MNKQRKKEFAQWVAALMAQGSELMGLKPSYPCVIEPEVVAFAKERHIPDGLLDRVIAMTQYVFADRLIASIRLHIRPELPTKLIWVGVAWDSADGFLAVVDCEDKWYEQCETIIPDIWRGDFALLFLGEMRLGGIKQNVEYIAANKANR